MRLLRRIGRFLVRDVTRVALAGFVLRPYSRSARVDPDDTTADRDPGASSRSASGHGSGAEDAAERTSSAETGSPMRRRATAPLAATAPERTSGSSATAGPNMKRRLRDLGLLVLIAGVIGALVVLSGVVPVKASTGHWAVTRWFLSFAMKRSVETWSMGTHVPDLDDPAMILRGAGHYDRGCQPCHGAPGDPSSAEARELTPAPPLLSEVVPEWDPAELFFIVHNGLKMTGMPAWPSQPREDEVWAMVAFLIRLPDLDEREYRRLAWGDLVDSAAPPGLDRLAGPVRNVAATCAQCHGSDGLGRDTGAFPRIAGQSPAYLAASLAAYARGDRCSGIMKSVAAALDEETVADLARHYGEATTSIPGSAGAPPGAGGAAASAALLDRGERIAHEGIPASRVPSCIDCHGPSDQPRNPFYPELAGQYANYMALQLRLFREERRGGSPYARIMHHAVHRLEQSDAEAVSAWYASLPWNERTDTVVPVGPAIGFDARREELEGSGPGECGLLYDRQVERGIRETFGGRRRSPSTR